MCRGPERVDLLPPCVERLAAREESQSESHNKADDKGDRKPEDVDNDLWQYIGREPLVEEQYTDFD